MNKSNLKVGDILRVKQGSEFHYEKVIQLTPEILTEDMPPDIDSDVSTQGLSDNLKYEIVETHTIAMLLEFADKKFANGKFFAGNREIVIRNGLVTNINLTGGIGSD